MQGKAGRAGRVGAGVGGTGKTWGRVQSKLGLGGEQVWQRQLEQFQVDPWQLLKLTLGHKNRCPFTLRRRQHSETPLWDAEEAAQVQWISTQGVSKDWAAQNMHMNV